MTFAKGTFQLVLKGKGAGLLRPVANGYVSACGRFGIHARTLVDGFVAAHGDPYVLTHIPTGCAFGLDFRTLADAKLAVTRFAALAHVDWSSTDARFLGKSEGARELFRAMKRFPLYRSHVKGIPVGRAYANPHADIDRGVGYVEATS